MEAGTLAQVAAEVARVGAGVDSLGALRAAFPGIHFSHCRDDDVTRVRPIFEGAVFNLYAVDGSNHCLQLTTDLNAATGILVAEIGPDD